MPAAWSAWLDKPQQVRAQASFRVAAPADHVVELLRRPDAMLLVPGTVDLVPVPSTGLVVQIHRKSEVTVLNVLDARPVTEPSRVVSWWSPRTSTMTHVDVAPAGSSARVTVLLEHDAESRTKARAWRDVFEVALPAWRERLTAVATGFQPFPAHAG